MKVIFQIFTLFLMITVIILGCSEDKNPLPSVSHPEGWNNSEADNFHGGKVLEMGYSSCKVCHGIELDGGKANVSCYQCHQTYPHPSSWIEVDNDQNHGEYVKNNAEALTLCTNCHGEDLTGGKSGVSCYNCHAAGSLPF